MSTFPGYAQISMLDFSNEDYERYAIVYCESSTGRVLVLDTSGCLCCGTALDDLDLADADEFTSLAELSAYLVGALNDAEVDVDRRADAEEEIRDAALAAAGLFTPAAVLALTS